MREARRRGGAGWIDFEGDIRSRCLIVRGAFSHVFRHQHEKIFARDKRQAREVARLRWISPVSLQAKATLSRHPGGGDFTRHGALQPKIQPESSRVLTDLIAIRGLAIQSTPAEFAPPVQRQWQSPGAAAFLRQHQKNFCGDANRHLRAGFPRLPSDVAFVQRLNKVAAVFVPLLERRQQNQTPANKTQTWFVDLFAIRSSVQSQSGPRNWQTTVTAQTRNCISTGSACTLWADSNPARCQTPSISVSPGPVRTTATFLITFRPELTQNVLYGETKPVTARPTRRAKLASKGCPPRFLGCVSPLSHNPPLSACPPCLI